MILRNISLNNNTWSLTHLPENILSQLKASIAFSIRSLLAVTYCHTAYLEGGG